MSIYRARLRNTSNALWYIAKAVKLRPS